MDRKNDGMGNLSVATRRVTTENAPLPGFCETRKDAPRVLAVPSKRPPPPSAFPSVSRKKPALVLYINKLVGYGNKKAETPLVYAEADV